jgi:hypothetical protein
MGGFAFDTGRDPSIPLPQTRYTLTPVGICFLAAHRPDLMPNITTDAINDKSKASPIAKALILTQALWFGLQIISRLAMRLPISALELNTLAHVLFTFCAFAAWWRKPLDIYEPILIPLADKPSAASLCAAMYLRSTIGFLMDGCLLEYSWPRPDSNIERNPDATVDNEGHHAITKEARSSDIPTITLKEGESKQGFRFRYTDGGDKCYEWVPNSCWSYSRTLEISKETQICYDLAQESILKHTPLQCDPFQTSTRDEDEETPFTHLAFPKWHNDYLTVTSSNWPQRIKIGAAISGTEKEKAFLGLVASGMLYGSIHLFAWDGPLHSETELILWRVASFTLAASGGLVVLCVAGYRLHKALEDSSFSCIYAPFGLALKCLCFLALMGSAMPMIFVGVLYLLSRVYLVIEGFINLPFVPDEVYHQPQWSKYFPHIG